MKRILFIILLLPGVAHYAHSQLITTLTVNRPSATLSEWYNSSTIIYIVESVGPVNRQAVIKTVLKTSDGAVVASKDLSKAQVFSLQGSRTFSAKEVIPLEIMAFTGAYKKTLEQTGKLPSGTYQIEVQLVDPGNFSAVSSVQAKIFNLAAPQLPYLVTPVNNDTLDAKVSENAIIFRWTPMVPISQPAPYYRLQVFEILPFQKPLQALRGNQPLLDKVLKAQTQYIWRPQISFSMDSVSKNFIWTIQTLDSNLLPYVQSSSNGESRSEPSLFSVRAPVEKGNKKAPGQ
jgi:hypothetical protein